MKMSERTYQAIIGVLVLVILLLGWWALAHRGTTAPQGDTTDTAMDDGTLSGEGSTGAMNDEATTSAPAQQGTATTVGAGESVSVADQSAGDSVAVASVTLSQPGWVAVRDTNGRTLGAAWVPAGTHTAVTVPLLRGTTAGESYQVLLYADNGDHQFDLHADTLITNADGSVPGTTFSAQ